MSDNWEAEALDADRRANAIDLINDVAADDTLAERLADLVLSDEFLHAIGFEKSWVLGSGTEFDSEDAAHWWASRDSGGGVRSVLSRRSQWVEADQDRADRHIQQREQIAAIESERRAALAAVEAEFAAKKENLR